MLHHVVAMRFSGVASGETVNDNANDTEGIS